MKHVFPYWKLLDKEIFTVQDIKFYLLQLLFYLNPYLDYLLIFWRVLYAQLTEYKLKTHMIYLMSCN